MGHLLSGCMVGLMVTSFKRIYATCSSSQACWSFGAPHTEPLSHCWPVLPQETLKHSKSGLAQSLVVSLSPGVQEVLFEPSKHIWWVWGLIPNMISPLLPSCWFSSFAIGLGVFFFFWWDPTFSCRWLFSSKLQFWSSRRRRWVHILLLHHLTTFRCTDVWNSPASYCAAKRHLCWVVDALLVVDWREETKVTFYSAMFLTSPLFLFFLIAYFLQQACITHAATELLNSFIF